MNTRRRYRTGFTLIEVMLTTAIAGMMLAVVMGLLGLLSRQVDAARSNHKYQPWLNVLRHQLEIDFANCRSVVVTGNEIRIDGYSSYSRETGTTSHLPTYIVYSLSGRSGTPSWLVRQETRLTGNINEAQVAVPVCYGVTGFQDMSNLDVDIPPAHWHLRLFVQSDDGELQKLDLVLHRHGGSRQ